MLRRLGALAAFLVIAPAYGSPHNPDTDWFRDAGWGVFVHYLWDVQNVGGRENAQGKPPTTWDALVREFDTEKFAEQVKETGAPYVFFTMMQRTRYLIAPNATYDKLTGYNPGEACSTRDLVADLHRSLDKRGIKLMLYWTGDGPREDAQAAKSLGGWDGRVSDQYVNNWADVVAEYSRRYGDRIKGWWVDGCYAHIGYNELRWRILANAIKAGNPHAIIALNNPAMSYANSSTDCDDFTTGEVNDFTDIPEDRWRDGKQFHVLSYLGGDWGKPGCRYDLAFLADYVSQVNEAGGVVTMDVALFRDGSLDPKQVMLLSRLRPAMKELTFKRKNRPPIPPGNLAYRKPAKLLSLDGTRMLPPNGGGGRLHTARCGVDGDPATDAQASNEWPWTYELDLTEPAAIRRVAITFGKNFATHFQVQLSSDHQTWTMVAEVEDHDGRRWEKVIAPVSARYLRIRALKPDGDHQRGRQMSVAELEVYTTENVGRESAGALLPAGFLSARGSQIIGPDGSPVRMASVGLTGMNVVGGRLQLAGPFKGIDGHIAAMRAMGFNCVRVDWIDKTLEDTGAVAQLDAFVGACKKAGLKVIFDNHNNEATRADWENAAQQKNGLWFDTGPGTDGTDGAANKGTVSAAKFQENWVTFAKHWAGNSTVIGFDIRNEPCAHTKTPALWGGKGPTDIHAMYEAVGNAILAVNPEAFIICEAVINYKTGAFQGDLSVVRSLPVVLSNPAKLVYSVHEYPKEIGGYRGPESGAGYIDRMNKMWGWLITENVAPVWIGEMGASMTSAASKAWGQTLLGYMNGEAPGGPTFSGREQPIGGDWWAWGCLTGQNPNGCVGEDGKVRPEQAPFINQMLFYPGSGPH